MESQKDPFLSKAISAPGSWSSLKNRKSALNTLDMFSNSPSVRPSNSGEQRRLLVGPVIGKVTQTTARILVEVDKDEDITVMLLKETETVSPKSRFQKSRTFIKRLGSSLSSLQWKRQDSIFGRSEGSYEGIQKIEKHVIGKRPTVFEFQGLCPGTRYIVQIMGPDGILEGASPTSSFRTFPGTVSEIFNVGVISCNKIFVTREQISSGSDLWAHLAKGIEARKIDLLVHLGDQIYGDGDKKFDAGVKHDFDKWSDRFHKAKEKLREVDPNQWHEHKESIRESYREVYRETWQHPPTAHCLANCPSLMIYDDHEIRDNWGDIEDDWKRDTLDFFIAKCAWIVSLEYQRQLHEDVDFTETDSLKIVKDYHFHVIGKVGLMFLDIRGSRTFHRVKDDKCPYLGSQQWKDIDDSLREGGIFQDINILLVCSPAPLVFVHPKITAKVANSVGRLEDFKGHWSVYINEQLQMISWLHKWKTSATARDILILGGDVHCGGHSNILFSNKTVMRQLTTSAIANRPLQKPVYYTLRLVEQLGNLSFPYTFKHHHWTRARNYGIVQIRTRLDQGRGELEVTAHLIRAKTNRISVGIKISNRPRKRKILWLKLSRMVSFSSYLFGRAANRRKLLDKE